MPSNSQGWKSGSRDTSRRHQLPAMAWVSGGHQETETFLKSIPRDSKCVLEDSVPILSEPRKALACKIFLVSTSGMLYSSLDPSPLMLEVGK